MTQRHRLIEALRMPVHDRVPVRRSTVLIAAVLIALTVLYGAISPHLQLEGRHPLQRRREVLHLRPGAIIQLEGPEDPGHHHSAQHHHPADHGGLDHDHHPDHHHAHLDQPAGDDGPRDHHPPIRDHHDHPPGRGHHHVEHGGVVHHVDHRHPLGAGGRSGEGRRYGCAPWPQQRRRASRSRNGGGPSGSSCSRRSSPPGCAPDAPAVSWRARTTCWATTTPAACTGRSTSRRRAVPAAAATASGAAPAAPGPVPGSASWETEIDTYLFGREREADELSGVGKDILLTRATDPEIHERGQDGGLVSAILLWCLEQDRIDAALVSFLEGDGSSWKAVPGVARTREEVLAAAGSRYTYSANTLAYAEAIEGGAERLALVGMSCQASVPGVMRARKAGKTGRRLALSIGLLCSKTFDDAIFDELFDAKYGLKRADIVKMNIKGVFQLWMRDGSYHEVPLKECHAWTREGCKTCPDFAAEHADISTGGIGADNDWTLTIVRTDAGREIIAGMLADGAIETRPADEDPGAMALLRKLSIVSRRRWPETAVPAPRLGVPPPRPKAPA